MPITVFTCDENDQEGRDVGQAQLRVSPQGRRILRIDMEALPVRGGLCVPLGDVLALALTMASADDDPPVEHALH